jgi:hypothetical protein
VVQRSVSAVRTGLRSTHAQRGWRTATAGAVITPYQRKVTAGAASIVRREQLTRSFIGPPRIASNIPIPSLDRQPDRSTNTNVSKMT